MVQSGLARSTGLIRRHSPTSDIFAVADAMLLSLRVVAKALVSLLHDFLNLPQLESLLTDNSMLDLVAS